MMTSPSWWPSSSTAMPLKRERPSPQSGIFLCWGVHKFASGGEFEQRGIESVRAGGWRPSGRLAAGKQQPTRRNKTNGSNRNTNSEHTNERSSIISNVWLKHQPREPVDPTPFVVQPQAFDAIHPPSRPSCASLSLRMRPSQTPRRPRPSTRGGGG